MAWSSLGTREQIVSRVTRRPRLSVGTSPVFTKKPMSKRAYPSRTSLSWPSWATTRPKAGEYTRMAAALGQYHHRTDQNGGEVSRLCRDHAGYHGTEVGRPATRARRGAVPGDH